MLGRPWGAWRLTALASLTAGLFVTYLVALSPHLVHHLFDENQGHPACPHLAQSQQTPELPSDPPALDPPVQSEPVQLFLASASLPSPDLTGSHPRAPPRSAPSV
jgi:hypothetical protein